MAGKDGKAVPYNPADYAPEWRTDYHPKAVDEPFTLHGEGFPGLAYFLFRDGILRLLADFTLFGGKMLNRYMDRRSR
jgi:hypothetical protein